MTAAQDYGCAADAPRSWAVDAIVHMHCMAAWWSQIHVRPRRHLHSVVGNVVFLPAPVAGYRIRHEFAGSVVEIKPRRAAATEIARCLDVVAARQLVARISADHHRPFLGEIGEVAA